MSRLILICEIFVVTVMMLEISIIISVHSCIHQNIVFVVDGIISQTQEYHIYEYGGYTWHISAINEQ